MIKRILAWIDSTRQSPFSFKWTWVSLLGVLGAAWLVYAWRGSWFIAPLFDNILVYFPTYLIHEFAHRIGWGATHSAVISLWAGPMAQIAVPCIFLWICWHISGGRWLSVLGWYYGATCWYSTAVYCGDARAKTLYLTSSDMMSSSGPGTAGDWYYMLGSVGLLEYDTVLAAIFYFLGALSMVLAFYSAWYYWTHLKDFMRQDLKPDPWRQAAVPSSYKARITAADYERDPFTGQSFKKR